MSRIQRLGIGNGGINCEISYMQAKKYPNATEIVKPVEGVSNRTLLKNPFNTLSVSVPQPGERPLRITTDNLGNVFARSETMLVKGVTNDTLLKNPYNIKSVAASEKRTLTLQRIKDINSKALPSFITENKGINEVMLQVLTMIENKQVKLITIQLLKILITKNVPVNSAHTEQKFLQALNLLDTVLTVGRRIFKENTLSPTNIATALRPAITTYVSEIIKLYNINANAEPANIDTEIQIGIAELGLMSNALTRMFEYANAIEPSNTLSRDQINAAAYTGFGQQAPQPQEEEPQVDPDDPDIIIQPPQPQAPPPQPQAPQPQPQAPQQPPPQQVSLSSDVPDNPLQSTSLRQLLSNQNTITFSKNKLTQAKFPLTTKMISDLEGLNIRYGDNLRNNDLDPQGKNDARKTLLRFYSQKMNDLLKVQANRDGIEQEISALQKIDKPMATELVRIYTPLRDFFFQKTIQPQVASGRHHRRQPQNSKVVFQVGKATQYPKY